jgi:hypothetical protein
MRILLVGAGGVGTAFARIAARRPFAELVVADYDLGRAQRAAAARDGYQAVALGARDEQAAAGLLRRHRCDVLMNATDPRFVMPLFRAALQAGTHYLVRRRGARPGGAAASAVPRPAERLRLAVGMRRARTRPAARAGRRLSLRCRRGSAAGACRCWRPARPAGTAAPSPRGRSPPRPACPGTARWSAARCRPRRPGPARRT